MSIHYHCFITERDGGGRGGGEGYARQHGHWMLVFVVVVQQYLLENNLRQYEKLHQGSSFTL